MTGRPRRQLPLEHLSAGMHLYRIAQIGRDAVFFGPPVGPTGRRVAAYRFDDPLGEYGVCYLGHSREAAVCETFLRDPAVLTISRTQADLRKITTVEVLHDLPVVQVHGPGLARLGVTAALTDGPYSEAQQWSRAVYERDASVAGLSYRARHDNSQFAVALYDRINAPTAALRVVDERGVRDDRVWFGEVLDWYGRGLD